MKKLHFVFSLFLIFIPNFIQAQIILDGAEMPATLQKDSTILILNGAGVRNKYFIDVYVGGLYLKAKNNKDKSIIDVDEPMAVRLHIISSKLTMDRMVEAIREGFDRSLLGRTAKYRSQIDTAVEIFKSGPVQVGDVFDIWYTPNKGVTASKNGVDLHILIPGIGFKKALMGIWLCPKPVDYNLKLGMLGIINLQKSSTLSSPVAH